MKNKFIIRLSLAIAFQFVILTGMYMLAAMPLWTGKEIRVKTIPVDPRSMFRGNYARLRYDFSRINSSYFPVGDDLRNGEKVYITMKADNNNYYRLSSVSLTKPSSGVYLSGRVDNGRYLSSPVSEYRIKYGIEAFFAPKKKALALETNLRSSGIAVLMVSSDGKARIKDVIAEKSL